MCHQKPQPSAASDSLSDNESDMDEHPPFFSTPLHPFLFPHQITLLKHISPSFSAFCPVIVSSIPLMASKIIAPFVGPLMPASINEWLSQYEDGFAIYTSTKLDKSPKLNAVTQIRLTGTQLHEPSMAAWWNAGRKEFLKLASWDLFEKKIHVRFMAKGYKLIALHMFFLCSQGKTPFLKYAVALTKACNVVGTIAISTSIYKYQLLFHSHTVLLL
jgi:hypothetical protein